MKIDLIIPVYNNKLGLCRSLFSLGVDAHNIIDVTIVDDNSTEDYSAIITFFQQFIPIQYIKLPQNVGPGLARQHGIDNTFNDYLMFLDCGDYYVTPDHLQMIYDTICNDTVTNLFCWGHTRGPYQNLGSHHNRMHGKVYKRQFLQTHNIKFNPAGSYANEDIGFNMAVKMILRQYALELNQSFIYYNDDPVIVWDTRDTNSLTIRGNYAFYYSIQNEALAENGGYALQLARREKVCDDLLMEQTYEIMCDMYFKYLSTLSVRQEFTDQAFKGAVRFYKEHFRPIAHNEKKLLEYYYNTLVQYLSDENDPIRTKFATLDFIEFLNLLEKQEN